MILIGTSGWSYDHWYRSFYPPDTDDPLSFYTDHFRTVEINNSFYQLPKEDTWRAWRDKTPDGFTFAVKSSRYITHMKKLKDPTDSLKKLLTHVDLLGDKLGPILFQTPDKWHFNAGRLTAFLEALPGHYRYAFEFRDPGWHNKRTYDLLNQHNAAFCIYEYAGYITPRETTADFVYIRLHGPKVTPYEGEYGKQALTGWAGAITAWERQGRDVYCYFDNDQAGYAPQDALRLIEMTTAKGGA